MVKQNKSNQTDNPEIIRIGTYSRTSGKDRVSISNQQEGEKRYANTQPNWRITVQYVDRCKSGASIAGRDDYQRALKDAADGKIDILLPFDISRFGRDGLDIIRDSDMLKREYGVYVVDSKGQFDNRNHHKIMTNFIFAGVAEDERLRIMERTIGGRIKNAEKGLPWSANPPDGRSYDKKTGKWYINDKGKMLQELLPRYAKGETCASLAREFGIKFPETITRIIRTGQLSGTYKATFNSPEIGINNLKVPVPAVPPVITPELERQCRERAAFNHKWNKQDERKYLLTGFLYCARRGHPLKGRTEGRMYYTHYYKDSKLGCPFTSVRGDVIEPAVLDYLYGLFLDEPSYSQAVKNALPSDEDRKALEKDIRQIDKQLAGLDKEESNLAKAIRGGAVKKTNIIIQEQQGIIDQRQALENRKGELEQTLTAMPDSKQIRRDAKFLRVKLMTEYEGQDWRQLSYEDIRRFLHFLFGVNPKKNNFGIFVDKINGEWIITFKGCTEGVDASDTGAPPFDEAIDMLRRGSKQKAEKEGVKVYTPSVKPKTLNSLRVG